MPDRLRLSRDLTEPEPIPEAGIARANELMRSGRLFRYGEQGADSPTCPGWSRNSRPWSAAGIVSRSIRAGPRSFLALKVLGVAPGDPVLVNGFTLAPVPGAILHAGAKPVVVGIGADLKIDVEDLRRKAGASGARVLLLSHMRGHLADMDAVMAVCEEFGLRLVEDCAHALCATWAGRTIGPSARRPPSAPRPTST